MNYKALCNLECKISDLQSKEEQIINVHQDEIHISEQENFEQLLANIKNSNFPNNIKNEKRKIALVKSLRKFVRENYQKINICYDMNIFYHFETLKFLMEHSFEPYSVRLRKASMKCLGAFIGGIPASINYILQNQYLSLIEVVVKNYFKEDDMKQLAGPVFQSLGNLFFVNSTFLLNHYDHMLQKEIPLIKFIEITSAFLGHRVNSGKSYVKICFFLNRIFLQKNLVLSEDEALLILQTIQRVICLGFSDDNKKNGFDDGSQVNALRAIENYFYYFNQYEPEQKRLIFLASDIHKILHLYFSLPQPLKYVKEIVEASKIIAYFYQFGIPDLKCNVFNIIPLLNCINSNCHVEMLCEDLIDIIVSIGHIPEGIDENGEKILSGIEALFSKGLFVELFNLFKGDNTRYTTKMMAAAVVAACINVGNLEQMPFILNDPYCMNCIFEMFISILEDDSSQQLQNVIMAMDKIYQFFHMKGSIEFLNKLMNMYSAEETLAGLCMHENYEVSAYAIDINSILTINLNEC